MLHVIQQGKQSQPKSNADHGLPNDVRMHVYGECACERSGGD
jgi:hypothetical protein